MRTLLEIYFGINLFGTGVYIGQEFNSDKNKILRVIFGLLFLCITAACIVVGYLASQLWLLLDRKTFLVFWWHFYIMRDNRNLPVDRLTTLNRQWHELEPGRKKDRWEYILAKLNKAHNYTFVPKGVWVKELKSWVQDDHEFSEAAAEFLDEYCSELADQEGMTRPVNEEDEWEAQESARFMWEDKGADLILAKVDEWRLLGEKLFPEGEIDILRHMNQYKEY